MEQDNNYHTGTVKCWCYHFDSPFNCIKSWIEQTKKDWIPDKQNVQNRENQVSRCLKPTSTTSYIFLALFLLFPTYMYIILWHIHTYNIYSRTPITRTRITRTKSNFPLISPYFSFIFTRWTRTRVTQIPRYLKLCFISLDQKFTEINLNNLNSGSYNSTRTRFHYLFF